MSCSFARSHQCAVASSSPAWRSLEFRARLLASLERHLHPSCGTSTYRRLARGSAKRQTATAMQRVRTGLQQPRFRKCSRGIGYMQAREPGVWVLLIQVLDPLVCGLANSANPQRDGCPRRRSSEPPAGLCASSLAACKAQRWLRQWMQARAVPWVQHSAGASPWARDDVPFDHDRELNQPHTSMAQQERAFRHKDISCSPPVHEATAAIPELSLPQ